MYAPANQLVFASLGSGSKGNGTLVAHGADRLLVDCGFTIRHCVERMAELGAAPNQLSGIFVTHEHSDHSQGVARLARKFDIPVFLTHGTLSRLRARRTGGDIWDELDVRVIAGERPVALGSLTILPVTVPHDAREPVQFVVQTASESVGILTDLGHVTPHVVAAYEGCSALLLECNHDADLLWAGSYPPALKRRVGGHYGHLNNQQAARLLTKIQGGSLRQLVLAHLSEENNSPEHARAAIDAVLLDNSIDVVIADQADGFDWVTA